MFLNSHIRRTLNFCHVSTLFPFPFGDIISSSFSPAKFLGVLHMKCAKKLDWPAQCMAGRTVIQQQQQKIYLPDDAVFSAFIVFPFAVVSLK